MNRFFVSKARICTGDYGFDGHAVGVVDDSVKVTVLRYSQESRTVKVR